MTIGMGTTFTVSGIANNGEGVVCSIGKTSSLPPREFGTCTVFDFIFGLEGSDIRIDLEEFATISTAFNDLFSFVLAISKLSACT